MKWLRAIIGSLLGVVVSLSIVSACDAKTINAASCQFSDVSSAVAQASAGDIVKLPAGTATWTQTLTLNGVSLLGSGTNATILVDEVSRSAATPQVIILKAVAGSLSEISNIQFRGGVINTNVNYLGAITANGSAGSSWRIDHNMFNGLYAKNIATTGNSMSVIDHNAFFEKVISIECNEYIQSDGQGDQSWHLPATYGLNSSNVMYVENNFFTNMEPYVASVGACDGEGGGRIVFRYNTVWNDCFNNHGTETGGRIRSQRSFEIYGNTFTCPSSSPVYPIYAAAMIRGGSGVIFSNTASGYQSMVAFRYYRFTCSYLSKYSPFGGANGLSPYDSNSATIYLSGINSAPNGSPYLQASGVNWTPNQWTGYTVLNTNTQVFAQIISNTVNTIYYIGSTTTTKGAVPCTLLTFNVGDHFQIYKVYAGMDQPGRGSGDLLKDNGMITNSAFPGGITYTINTVTGKPSWPNQVLEGIYCWANKLNGTNSEESSLYPGILAGREFYNDTPMPGYTPFVYPHPLVSGISITNVPGGTTNNVGGTTNVGGGTTNVGGGTTNVGGGTTNVGGGTTNVGGGTTNVGGGTTNVGGGTTNVGGGTTNVGGGTTNVGGGTTNVGGGTTNVGGATTNAGGTTNIGGTNILLPPANLHFKSGS
jgi:hypothetical protein